MFSKSRVYLDAAAAVPVRKEAARAYARALSAFGNPSSPHEEGRAAHTILEQARKDIARLTEVKPDDVVFTSGATEANNLAILGLAQSFQKDGLPAHVLYLPSAHASIIETVQALAKWGVAIEALPITSGRVDIGAFIKMIRSETRLVSMDAVCGETGTIWNTREVADALRRARGGAAAAPIYLHVDASQAPLTQKFTRSHFDVDLLTLDASKVGGVRGVGVLIAHRTIPIQPLTHGGGQERGLRSGTEHVAGAAAFAEALKICAKERDAFVKRASHARSFLVDFVSTHISNTELNQGKEYVPHIANFSFSGRDTDYLVALLDEAGFAVSTKSACETDSQEGSRAVFALTHDKNRASSTLRASFLPSISESQIRRFAKALKASIAFIDRKAS